MSSPESGKNTGPAQSARDKVREMQARDKRRTRRNRLLLQGGVVVLALAVIAAIVFAVNANRAGKTASGSETPANFVGSGITFDENGVVTGGATASPTAGTGGSAPAKVVVYFDMQCPVCAQFESGNAEQLQKWTDAGDAVVEYRPISFLDKSSTTQYSSRAGNAVLAAADQDPAEFRDYVTLLFAHQPSEGGSGLTDDQLLSYAKQAGVTGIDDAVKNKSFGQFLTKATNQALNEENVQGTPTVLVNGRQYDPQAAGAQSWADSAAFAKFFAAARAEPTQGDGEAAPTASAQG